MGVAMCAVYPSGPVSPEIRLTRWCRVLIINEPNFIKAKVAKLKCCTLQRSDPPHAIC